MLRRLRALVAPDGHLFVGHTESLTGLVDGLRCVMPTVYTPATDVQTSSNRR